VRNANNQELLPSLQKENQHSKPVSPVKDCPKETEQLILDDYQQTKSPKTGEKNSDMNQSASKISHGLEATLKYDIEYNVFKESHKYTMVGNVKLLFPRFNFGPVFFEKNRYSASNTCSLDSALFLLYYIYMTHSEEFRSLFDPNILVCQQLKRTFDLVNNEGWDVARIYWISIHTNYPNPRKRAYHHDLYGTADTNVFQYVREIQRHAIKSACTSSDCPKSMRTNHSVDISMP
jgi:hypothetical protein